MATSTQPTARAPTEMTDLATALAMLITRELDRGPLDRQTYAALSDMDRHIKGVQRALKRLADN